LCIGFTINPRRAEDAIPYAKVQLKEMVPQQMDGGMTKLLNKDILIYVKPIPEFFSGEHTPLICWKGSGYEFNGIQKENIANHEIYHGVLQRNKEVLHTAWWYFNGEVTTIDQLKWRSMMMTGHKRFCLINVTAKDQATLSHNIKLIFENDLLVIR
jgi:exosortase N